MSRPAINYIIAYNHRDALNHFSSMDNLHLITRVEGLKGIPRNMVIYATEKSKELDSFSELMTECIVRGLRVLPAPSREMW